MAAIRSTSRALLALAILALAACAQVPVRPDGAASVQAAGGTELTPAVALSPVATPVATPVPTPVQTSADQTEVSVAETALAAGAAPAAQPEAAAPSAAAAPEGDASAPGAAAATEPTSKGGVNPAQFADLFDRMRAGFRLEDGEHAQVDQQLRWYVANPDYLQRAFGRADLYLYHIVTELEARGMPLELALLPVVESAFEPYAYSRASASGLWQFISDTGSRFGLKQDWWYDGRRDIVESTRAALDYLKSLHDEFGGDWLLAIAAYNCGEKQIERSVAANRAAGRPIDFWSLWLPRETRAYVPKLLAMKRLVQDPQAFGLEISPIPNQPYFTRVPTEGQINLKVAAQIAGISPEELYELNPAFHRWATDPAGPYFLLLPVDAADTFSTNLPELTPDQRLAVTHYTVRRGDSVVSVARHFDTTASVIRELNNLPAGRLTVGDDLSLPSAAPELPAKVILAAARVDGRGRWALRPHVQIVRRGDSLWAIARRHGMNVNTLALLNGMQPGDPLRAGQRIRIAGGESGHATHGRARRVVYTVRSGDTVALIAQLFQCSVPQILAWNGLSSHTRIHAGQKLRIHLVTRHS
jgi:membrane-bound lytic murein transglycosylase D